MKAASRSGANEASRDISATVINSNSEATPSVRSKRVKAKLDDILPILRKTFTERFVPLTRQYLGTQPPWSDISFSELQTLHRRAFGALADKHPLVEGDKCFKLVSPI